MEVQEGELLTFKFRFTLWKNALIVDLDGISHSGGGGLEGDGSVKRDRRGQWCLSSKSFQYQVDFPELRDSSTTAALIEIPKFWQGSVFSFSRRKSSSSGEQFLSVFWPDPLPNTCMQCDSPPTPAPYLVTLGLGCEYVKLAE